MKTSMYVLLLALGFSLACRQNKTLDFIPGVYVSHFSGTYSVADDTLRISLLQGNYYEILRSTGFNRLTDGKRGKREYEQEIWYALFDPNNHVLNERGYGKLISFYPDSMMLKVGSEAYKKIR